MPRVERGHGPRLIFVTQVVDPEDAVLGFVTELIRGLALYCDRLVVIANEVRHVPEDLGVEVVSLGKEHGAGRVVRGSRYLRAVWRYGKGMPADGLFAHMCPVYLSAAALVTKVLRVRSYLWFAHPSRSAALRVAEKLADVVLTSLPAAYPRPSPRLRAIGQAVPLERFSLVSQQAGPNRTLVAVALGRTTVKKGYASMIRGVTTARSNGVDVRLRIFGPSTTDAEAAHRSELQRSIADLDAGGFIELNDGVSPSEVPGLLAASDVLINSTVAGSADKVVFEAMAMGRLTLVSNPAFFDLLQGLPIKLTFAAGDAGDLGERLAELASLSTEVRSGTARELHARIERAHSLDSWAKQIAALVCERT